MIKAATRWVRAAEEKALLRSMCVTIEGHDVALFRTPGGLFALDDICSHEFSRLSEGEVWEGEVYCPKHGSRFDLRTGAVTGLPATEPVRTHQVKVEDGVIYLLWEGKG